MDGQRKPQPDDFVELLWDMYDQALGLLFGGKIFYLAMVGAFHFVQVVVIIPAFFLAAMAFFDNPKQKSVVIGTAALAYGLVTPLALIVSMRGWSGFEAFRGQVQRETGLSRYNNEDLETVLKDPRARQIPVMMANALPRLPAILAIPLATFWLAHFAATLIPLATIKYRPDVFEPTIYYPHTIDASGKVQIDHSKRPIRGHVLDHRDLPPGYHEVHDPNWRPDPLERAVIVFMRIYVATLGYTFVLWAAAVLGSSQQTLRILWRACPLVVGAVLLLIGPQLATLGE